MAVRIGFVFAPERIAREQLNPRHSLNRLTVSMSFVFDAADGRWAKAHGCRAYWRIVDRANWAVRQCGSSGYRLKQRRASIRLNGVMDQSVNAGADGAALRNRIIRSLRAQGFSVRKGKVFPPKELSKDRVRELHQTAVEHRLDRAKDGLFRREKALLQHIASGYEIVPSRISPQLVEVSPGSEEELLFRYASLHWSIPVSSGYGRRLRFLVIDKHNEKLIGLIGLGDPVYSLGSRDEWVGWAFSGRKKRLRNVMDAFVLGAVPPYSFLLCGKLVAMLAASDTIRHAFKKKYGGMRSIIRRKMHDGRLALITTTSALGRSSVYNRLRLTDRLLYQSVGFTKGYGEFHFSNGLYGALTDFAVEHCEPTERQKRWGTGFRNRREVIKKCLPAVGLSSEWANHGIEREVFVVPLARNTREFLQGEHTRLLWHHQSTDQMFEYFRDRWMLPRAAWDERYKLWSKEEWAIWLKTGDGHA